MRGTWLGVGVGVGVGIRVGLGLGSNPTGCSLHRRQVGGKLLAHPQADLAADHEHIERFGRGRLLRLAWVGLGLGVKVRVTAQGQG